MRQMEFLNAAYIGSPGISGIGSLQIPKLNTQKDEFQPLKSISPLSIFLTASSCFQVVGSSVSTSGNGPRFFVPDYQSSQSLSLNDSGQQ
jgi:hypothetical protein